MVERERGGESGRRWDQDGEKRAVGTEKKRGEAEDKKREEDEKKLKEEEHRTNKEGKGKKKCDVTKKSPEEQKKADEDRNKNQQQHKPDYIFTTVTTRAHFLYLFRLEAATSSSPTTSAAISAAFESAHLLTSRFFSRPRSIADGCAFLSSLSKSTATSNNSAPPPLTGSFKLYASDGAAWKEVEILLLTVGVSKAAGTISAAIRLSSLNRLPVSGILATLGNGGGKAEGKTKADGPNLLDERALLMLHEVRCAVLVLKACGMLSQDLENQAAMLEAGRVEYVSGERAFDGGQVLRDLLALGPES